MSILKIPTRTDIGSYRFGIQLDDVVYELIFQFNNRDDHWYFDIYNESGTLLRAGLKAVTGWPLLRLHQAQERPAGEIMAIDPTSVDLEAGLEDLGETVTLIYAEEESLE
jgi:hypothetical protein